MKILVVTLSDLSQFVEQGGYGPDTPKLSQAYPFYGYLKENGHEVEVISLKDILMKYQGLGLFPSYFYLAKNIKYILSFDVIFSWGFYGAWIANLLKSYNQNRKVATIIYSIWPPTKNIFSDLKYYLFCKGLSLCGVTLYMTESQASYAEQVADLDRSRIHKYLVGVDQDFFSSNENSENISEDLLNELNEPYIMVCGDQLRNEEAIIPVLLESNIKLVRPTQSTLAKDFWEKMKNKYSKDIKVFSKLKVSFNELRVMYKKALCVLNLTDNSWQPAGWSVMAESLSCGTPVIMKRGLVSNELDLYGGKNPVCVIDSERDISRIKDIIFRLKSDNNYLYELKKMSNEFAINYLNIKNTCNAVSDVINKIKEENG